MDEPRRSPLYLARASYRRRRLIDAQRLLPIFLFLLYLLPLLWGGAGPDDPIGGGVRAYIHVFTIWIGAIVCAAWIARSLMRDDTQDTDAARTEEGAHLPTRAAQYRDHSGDGTA